jgi:murein hydrolase activator
MKLSKIFIPVILAACFLADDAFGQSSYDYLRQQILERQQSTRSEIENLDRQIERYSKRLEETTVEFDEVYQRYEELNRLIALQQERLRQMNREQRQITEEIQLIENNLAELEERLKQLIDQYKSTLTYLYKHGRTTELALILTSTSINQLMVRSYYLSRFNDHLQSQIDEIEETQRQLEQSKLDLVDTQQRNEAALANIRQENRTLEQQQAQQKQVVETLQTDINSLEELRNRHQRQRDNLESTMANLIREEQRLRRAEATGEEPVRRELNLSEDEISAFETRFRDQRGQLPWPVQNGTVTERFGVRVNPLHNTRTQNPGIDISVSPRSSVSVVSDGYVYGVQPVQGYGQTIFVNHGTYNTAYGNMSEVFVRRNQVLRRGEVIGLSGDENSTRGSVLFFLIREGSQMVDPQQWLQDPRP